MNNKQHKNNYRIIRIEPSEGDCRPKKIVMKTFYAKDDAAALKYLKDYKKIANKEYTYYFDENQEDLFDRWRREDDTCSWWKKAWDEISFFFWYWFFDKPKDLCYWMKDLLYWMKTKHNRDESWSLDYHILNDLVHNIELLKKNKHGIAQPFIEMAIKERNKDTPDFDFDAYLKKTNYCGTKEDEDRAVELMDQEYDNQLLNVRLYIYYSNYGIVSKYEADYEAMKKIEEKYHNTLPYLPGRYKEFDYAKLNALIEAQWEKIWDWNKKWLRICWD